MSLYTREIQVMCAAAREAGALAQQGFGGPMEVEQKGGGEGPVSNYDKACDALLRQRIGEAFADDAMLTEETDDDGAWKTARRVWIIDPIDGTQEYVTGVPQYAIMIGLCVDGHPAAGVVFAPAQDLLLWGVVDEGATLEQDGNARPLQVTPRRADEAWRMAVSRSHKSSKIDRICEAMGVVEQMPMGSVGLKIASVSQGQTHCYMAATHRIKLWDTCGPHAVLAAAGGDMRDLRGRPLDYRETVNHPWGLLAGLIEDLPGLAEITAPLAADFFANSYTR